MTGAAFPAIIGNMKKDIHPTYFPQAKIICACGHKFATGAAKEKIEVEICSSCHPFYTGKKKILDTAGRVERFQKLVEKKTSAVKEAKPKKPRAKKQKAV